MALSRICAVGLALILLLRFRWARSLSVTARLSLILPRMANVLSLPRVVMAALVMRTSSLLCAKLLVLPSLVSLEIRLRLNLN
ncbi:hypothetical protein D9M69_491410 [compost metagenome]